MNRLLIIVVVCLLAGLAAGCTAATDTPADDSVIEPTADSAAGIANPASENCVALGGMLAIEERGDLGQIGVCYFEDNRQCEEWALMRGDCPAGGVKVTGYVTEAGRYCAITGGTYTVKDEGSDPEQGTCTFADGSQCDAWAYYNGECAPGSNTPSAIIPLSMELCNGQAQAMSHFLSDMIPTVTDEPLSDPVTGASGTGCQSTITGTGVDFESPTAVVDVLDAMLEEQGWVVDPMGQADGPTGTSRFYRKDNQICVTGAIWFPDESANCPDDQPITTCQLTPEQQNYTVTLNCGVEAQE